MENKSHVLAAGAFVLMLLALVVTLALWLTRETGLLQVYELSSRDAVTGLQPQASVRFKGVNVGKVTAIGLDPQVAGQVLIRIAIDEQITLTTASFATLAYQGVTGLAFVQLNDSGTSSVRLVANQEPPARIPLRPSLLAQWSEQGERILLQLEQTSGLLNQLLAPGNQQRLMTAIDQVGQAAASLEQLSTRSTQTLAPLVQETRATLQTVRDTSLRVGVSADEARASARAFRSVTERMNATGGTLDQLSQGADTLGVIGQTLGAETLPRLHRVLDEAARTARQLERAAGAVHDNPRTLIFGNPAEAPGPGEPGFSAPSGPP